MTRLDLTYFPGTYRPVNYVGRSPRRPGSDRPEGGPAMTCQQMQEGICWHQDGRT